MTTGRRPALPGAGQPGRARHLLPLAVALALHSAAVAAFVILPARQPAPTNLVLSIELVNERPGDAGAGHRPSGTAPPETSPAEEAMQTAGETGSESADTTRSAERSVPPIQPAPERKAVALDAPASSGPVAGPEGQPDAAEAIELVKRAEQAPPAPPMALIGDAISQQPPMPVRKPTLPPEASVRPAGPAPVEPAAEPPALAEEAAAPEPPTTERPAEVREARHPTASDQPAARSTPPSYVGLGGANPEPRYPYAARRRGEEGQVVLRVQVAADGRAQSVEIRASSGSHRLDAAALQTVERWRFRPATTGGAPVAGIVDVPITFRLEDGRDGDQRR